MRGNIVSARPQTKSRICPDYCRGRSEEETALTRTLERSLRRLSANLEATERVLARGAEVWFDRGKTLLEQRDPHEKVLKKTLECFDKAVEADPSYADAWNGRGDALCKQDNLEEAIESFDQCIEIDPSRAQAWHFRGNALVKQFKPEEALKSFEQCIEINSSSARAWYNRGIMLKQQGRPEEAVKSIDQACELDSSYCGPYPWEGWEK